MIIYFKYQKLPKCLGLDNTHAVEERACKEK